MGCFTESWEIERSTDERGSVIAIVDDEGTVEAVKAYDEDGITTNPAVGRFGYIGQAWLDEIGLCYYKARMYAPQLGRFLQTDPIGYGDGMNMFAYVGADPVNGRDPTGLGDDDVGTVRCKGGDNCSAKSSDGASKLAGYYINSPLVPSRQG